MGCLAASDWIAIGQSTILVATIIILILQHRQTSKHHREDLQNLRRTLRSQTQEGILSNLLALNRIMLEFPNEVKGAFEGLADASADDVRRYCYVYAILDVLHYLVLHQDIIDPYVEKHFRNLASLLYTEPKINQIFNEVKDQQSEALISFLENKVKPEIVGRDSESNKKA